MVNDSVRSKENWEKPQLVVLARNQPEEAVLFACKGGWNKGTAKSSKESCWIQSGPRCESPCNDIFTS